MLKKLMVGMVDGVKVYFDSDGRLYEKHPALSHYIPTLKFAYEEYGFCYMRLQCPEFVHIGENYSDYVTYEVIEERSEHEKEIEPRRIAGANVNF